MQSKTLGVENGLVKGQQASFREWGTTRDSHPTASLLPPVPNACYLPEVSGHHCLCPFSIPVRAWVPESLPGEGLRHAPNTSGPPTTQTGDLGHTAIPFLDIRVPIGSWTKVAE